MISRTILFTFLLIGLLVVAQAQGQSVSTMKLDYNLNGVKFKSSAKFKQREAKNLQPTAMLFVNRESEDESVFVLVPKTRQSLVASMESVRDALAVGLLPKESTSYQWRLVEKPYTVAAGKFDTEHGQMTGFNGKSRLLLEYHLIKFQNQQVVVGYLYVADKGERAALAFQRSLGGGNGSVGNECLTIVLSITGEEEPRVRPGMPPPPAPGSPPPPAPRKP